MMNYIFISHVEEDADVALEIALGLEKAGYKTWCYEIDSVPGTSYLIQTGQAVEQAKAIVVVISPHSISSRQVTKEVVRAHESGAEFIPILRGIKHIEFQNRQPEWREAIGAATSISIPSEGISSVLPRIIKGLEALDVSPGSKADETRIAQISTTLGELTLQTGKPGAEPVAVTAPPAEITKEATRWKEWLKPVPVTAAIVLVVAVVVILVWMFFLNQPETVTSPDVTNKSPAVPATTPDASDIAPPPTAAPEETAQPEPALTPAPATTTPTPFPDKNLEMAVRIALGKLSNQEITEADLMSLRSLDAAKRGVTDLTGIEHCLNLRHLYLNGNLFSDISALASLTNLKFLNIGGNSVSDISPLSSLTNLSQLHAWGNQISDIKPLASLANLTTLYIPDNQIKDISSLSSLVNLIEVNLGSNQISDIFALSSLPNLLILTMDYNYIGNLQPLADNSGISEGDTVTLTGNPLSPESRDVYIPQLEQRGVTIILE
jgi:cell division septation protein DedD